jgi:hypothetical protein
MTLTINPLLTPSITISASSTQICTGGNVLFSIVSTTNGGTSPTYQWQKNAVNIGGATSSTYSTTTLNDGDSISVIMSPSSEICTNVSSVSSNAIPISVYTTPATPGAITGDSALVL